MAKVQIDFYKPSGKWYSGGVVEINAKPWDRPEEILQEILQEIRDKQEILIKSDLSRWIIVLDNVPEDEGKPNEFWKRIIQIPRD